ncbi:MAG: hypothetical protein ACR2PW_05510 [Gammaproteobacteria bacterium]
MLKRRQFIQLSIPITSSWILSSYLAKDLTADASQPITIIDTQVARSYPLSFYDLKDDKVHWIDQDITPLYESGFFQKLHRKPTVLQGATRQQSLIYIMDLLNKCATRQPMQLHQHLLGTAPNPAVRWLIQPHQSSYVIPA